MLSFIFIALTITATPSPKIEKVYPHTVIVCSDINETISTLYIRQQLALAGLQVISPEELLYRINQKQKRSLKSKIALGLSYASLSVALISSSNAINVSKSVTNKLLLGHTLSLQTAELLNKSNMITPPPSIADSITCTPCASFIAVSWNRQAVSITPRSTKKDIPQITSIQGYTYGPNR